MSEKSKEDQLKEKLLEFFDKKLSDLTSKFTSDIEKIESYKNDYFDSVIKVYREIQQEQKQLEEQENVMMKFVKKEYIGYIKENAENLATKGLRTLVLTQKIISKEDFEAWNREYQDAISSMIK